MKSLSLVAAAALLLGLSSPAMACDDCITGAVGVDAIGNAGQSGDSKAGDTLLAPSTLPVRN